MTIDLKRREDGKYGLTLFVPNVCSYLLRHRHSKHFTPEDFERQFFTLPGFSKPNYPKLLTDDLGVCLFPTVHTPEKTKAGCATASINENDESQLTARHKRSVSIV